MSKSHGKTAIYNFNCTIKHLQVGGQKGSERLGYAWMVAACCTATEVSSTRRGPPNWHWPSEKQPLVELNDRVSDEDDLRMYPNAWIFLQI